ncbi:hypothetical protein FH972_026117 [Carpinus fangiana]|uniref:DUF2428 domain-containing protein n=1 Tax=Carpinus fangiana TaxID=176857 RepID=A0A5N6L5L7_9ROSI|nr:hypothetical protein FH972_026117 [Carpinus fangiana]
MSKTLRNLDLVTSPVPDSDQTDALPINEDELRDIGRTLQPTFASQTWTQLKNRLTSLLETASLPDLAPGHRVAAFNALCGFIDQCLRSEDEEVIQMAYDPELCSSLLAVYLRRYEYTRNKSMKQLLGSVTKAIARQPIGSGVYTRTDSLEILLTVVCDASDEVRAKPAFHVLSALISKQLIPASEILATYGNRHDISSIPPQDARPIVGKFLDMLFGWIRQPDVAPIVGSFLPIFLRSLDTDLHEADRIPIWARSLVLKLQETPEDLLSFRFYVLPGLFQLKRADYWVFLNYIGLCKHLGVDRTYRISGAVEEVPDHPKNSNLLFTSLQIGKELGLLQLSDVSICSGVAYEDHAILICDKLVGNLLGDSDLSVRLAGISLLISSKQQSRLFTPGTLKSLKFFLPHSLVEPDANFRSELLSLIQDLVERIKAVSSFLSRSVLQHKKRGEESSAEALGMEVSRHRRFLEWLMRFATAELHPHASYQRHITALKLLMILLKSGLDVTVPSHVLSKLAKSELCWGFRVPIIDRSLRRVLLDGLMDPFEDVRQLSASIVKLTSVSAQSDQDKIDQAYSQSPGLPCGNDNTVLQLYRSSGARAKDIMQRSGRIDHADGFARFSDVCFDYLVATSNLHEEQSVSRVETSDALISMFRGSLSQIATGIETARENLAKAVDRFPLHGQLTCMRYLLEDVAKSPEITAFVVRSVPTAFADLEALIHDVWYCVRDTLCNDAPEGFLPDEAEEEVSMRTKDLLSYCWRALKESSLLLRSLVVNVDLLCAQSDQQRILKSLGTLCFTQLAELRHRGAFSTVAQSFATVCLQCRSSTVEEARFLNSMWYTATLDLIQTQGSKITRRSAGIPAAVVGLLTAGIDFGKAVNDLEKIAMRGTGAFGDGQVDLPQVHALNCLRAAFSATKVAAESDPYIVKVIGIAAKALSSDLWPIRNCGLMLLRGLIDRLLGSHESFDDAFAATTGSRLAYDRYPGLLELLVSLLRPTVATDDATVDRQEVSAESLFPALDLFRRAPPPPEACKNIVELVLQAADSSQWHIREVAARAFAALSPNHLKDNPNSLIGRKVSSGNIAHAKILCVKYIVISSLQNKQVDVDGHVYLLQLSQRIRAFAENWATQGLWNPIIGKTFLETINILGSEVINKVNEHSLAPAPQEISSEISQHSFVQTRDNLQLALVHIIMLERSDNLAATYAGKDSLESTMALSQIIIQLINSVSEYEQEPGSHSRAISEILDLHSAEVFEQIVTSVLALSVEKQLPGIVLLPFTEALSSFIQDGVLSDAQLTKPPLPLVDCSQYFKIRDVARIALANIYRQLQELPGISLGLIQQSLVVLELHVQCWDVSSPSTTQGLLELWGASIDAKYSKAGVWSQGLVNEANIWIKFVEAALSDTNEFPLRHAAALSLGGLQHALTSIQDLPEPLAVSIHFALYTALNDDDEEIRDLASTVVTRISHATDASSSNNRTSSAAVAAHKLCTILIKQHSSSPQLVHEAIKRMTGQPITLVTDSTSDNPPAPQSVATRLQAALQEDAALFVVEKQNLYIDPVREAATWSAVLRHVAMAAVSHSTAETLAAWVVAGLRALHAHIAATPDGPLGWTAKPEVFALGMQVFAAADVVLEWRRKSKKVRTRASEGLFAGVCGSVWVGSGGLLLGWRAVWVGCRGVGATCVCRDRSCHGGDGLVLLVTILLYPADVAAEEFFIDTLFTSGSQKLAGHASLSDLTHDQAQANMVAPNVTIIVILLVMLLVILLAVLVLRYYWVTISERMWRRRHYFYDDSSSNGSEIVAGRLGGAWAFFVVSEGQLSESRIEQSLGLLHANTQCMCDNTKDQENSIYLHTRPHSGLGSPPPFGKRHESSIPTYASRRSGLPVVTDQAVEDELVALDLLFILLPHFGARRSGLDLLPTLTAAPRPFNGSWRRRYIVHLPTTTNEDNLLLIRIRLDRTVPELAVLELGIIVAPLQLRSLLIPHPHKVAHLLLQVHQKALGTPGLPQTLPQLPRHATPLLGAALLLDRTLLNVARSLAPRIRRGRRAALLIAIPHGREEVGHRAHGVRRPHLPIAGLWRLCPRIADEVVVLPLLAAAGALLALQQRFAAHLGVAARFPLRLVFALAGLACEGKAFCGGEGVGVERDGEGGGDGAAGGLGGYGGGKGDGGALLGWRRGSRRGNGDRGHGLCQRVLSPRFHVDTTRGGDIAIGTRHGDGCLTRMKCRTVLDKRRTDCRKVKGTARGLCARDGRGIASGEPRTADQAEQPSCVGFIPWSQLSTLLKNMQVATFQPREDSQSHAKAAGVGACHHGAIRGGYVTRRRLQLLRPSYTIPSVQSSGSLQQSAPSNTHSEPALKQINTFKMKLSTLALLSTTANALSIGNPDSNRQLVLGPQADEQLYLVQTSPTETKWVTEDDKWELRRQGINFLDITDNQSLGSLHAESPDSKKVTVTFPSKTQYNSTVRPLLKSLDKANMRSHLETFTSFHTRYYKSTTGKESSEWLLEQVTKTVKNAKADKHGATVEPFEHPWGQNSIIARFPGQKNTTVVIGAHQDSINLFLPSLFAAPGADDDGSGTVTILEALRVLLTDQGIVKGKQRNTVEFHWYSAEEGGLLGSQAIFSSYEKEGRDVRAMLQQDMTGYIQGTLDAGQPESVGVITDFVDPGLTDFIKKVIEEYCDIPYIETKCGYACSDHASASKAGYPSAFVIESDFANSDHKIHTTEDKIEYLSFDHMLQHARLTLGLAVELSNAKL